MKTKDSGSKSKRTSRREFTKRVAASLVVAPLASTLAVRAQTPAGTKQASAPPNPQPSPATAQQDKPSPLAVAYAEVARARFGQQVSAEQFEQIEKDLEGNVRVAERLRAFKLQNADEPDFVFSAG